MNSVNEETLYCSICGNRVDDVEEDGGGYAEYCLGYVCGECAEPYRCEWCGKLHEDVVGLGIERVCPECFRLSEEKEGIKAKEYVCSKCGRTFWNFDGDQDLCGDCWMSLHK